ncbi:MAG: D-alanyl-D-alanine carboxypeptidase [Betaproteobacteria bacterium]|nr:D-alanyl-D-alanine carboxypeptidase [Betaproteobacteria bacterium]
MKKIQFFFLVLLLVFGVFTASSAQTVSPPTIVARSWLLLDTVSGQILASRDAYKRIEPASLTKLMTAYLVFSAIREGRLSLNQSVTVSDQIRELNKNGLRMFIEPRVPVKIQDLLYGLIVQSGNDAALALAEAVSGDEAGFVVLMNREAERMGMKSTHFSNPYGAPDKDHYSTAYDLSILAANLIRDYPELYKIYSIREFTYNRIRQRNSNRLLWLDPTVDGVQAGHTETSGYSLISSAKREGAIGERRMMTVMIGASSDQMRAQESLKLLNWGFENFDTVKLFKRKQVIAMLNVWKGSKSELPVGFNFDAYVSVPRGASTRLKSVLERKEPLVAPIDENSRVGTLKMMLDGKVISELPVVALEQVGVASFLGRMWDTIQLWFK